MNNPYTGYVVRIDQMFNGTWRVRMIDAITLVPAKVDSPMFFPTRAAAWEAARTLAVWFSVEVEEVGNRLEKGTTP